MKVSKKWLIPAVLILILNMVIATQYATTKIGYEYYIVHPSDANIRYIGSDNSSDSIRVLRVIGDNITNVGVKLRLGGNFTTNMIKTYTAAFGIVNEENFTINITYFTLSGENTSYFDIWIHGNRTEDYPDEGDCSTRVMVIDNGVSNYDINSCIWQLAQGDMNASTMCADGTTQLDTLWDEQSHVRYSKNNANNSVNGTSDFVWVGISITVPADAALQTASGTLVCYFKSDE